MVHKLSCATVALVSAFSSVASANTLVIEPTSTNLAATSYEYRINATKRLYDFSAYAMFKDLRGEELEQSIKDPEHSMFWYSFLTTFRKCEEYDVLQGESLFDEDSWYLAAFHHQAEMTLVNGGYTTTTKLTAEEKTCGGKLWTNSSVSVQWTSPTDPAQQLQGVIQLVSDPRAKSTAEVTCTQSDNPDDYYGLTCSAATVSFSGKQTTIVVRVNGVD